jgi:alpha-glucosidase
MNKMKAFIPVAMFLITAGCNISKKNTGRMDCKGTLTEADSVAVTRPPSSYGFNSFYKKYVDANGIPVIGSWRVPDRAFWSARKIIVFLTESLPENVRKSLIDHGTRVGIMARYEGTTDIPEHAHLAADTSLNWDVRARGLGGGIEMPLTTCAEENLLCFQLDKYHAEDILIHEFAHTIHGVGILPVDSTFNDRLQSAMDKALAEGKWKNTYAATNIWEYWAEGVQDWFNVNGEVEINDGKHNQVNLRKELKEYDPGLYEILSEYFPETDECISCHSSTVNIYSVEQ